MINFSRLVSTKFIFNLMPGVLSAKFAIFFYTLFGLSLIFGILSYFIKKKQKITPQFLFWNKLNLFFSSFGAIGFFLIFFRQEKVYFLSMPFLWYLFFLSFVVWAIFILRWNFVRRKQIEKEIEVRKEKEKYLP